MNDSIVALLTYLTQSLGSLGCAIITLSLGIRISLLPLTIKLARRAQRNQEMMRVLQPEIEQFVNERKEQFREMFKQKQFAAMNTLFAKLDANTNVIKLPDGLRYEILKSGSVPYIGCTDM